MYQFPFDALMGLAENAKLERQANEKRLEDLKVKYGNFTSRSQADMNRWNQQKLLNHYKM